MSIAADMDEVEAATPRPSGLGPSDVGSCRAFLEYRESGTSPDPGWAEDTRASTIGTLIHDGYAKLNAERYPDGLHEYSVSIPGLDRAGRVDSYLDGVVRDLKTLGIYAFDRLVERGEPRRKDRQQVNVYGLAMASNDFAVTTCEVLYLNRSNGHEQSFSWPFDADEAKTDLAWLLGVQDAIDNSYELPRDGRGPGLGFPCDWRREDGSGNCCPFLARCWDLENVPEGRSAQSAMVVTDEQIVAAAAEFLAAKVAKADAKDRYEAAQAALVGLGGVVVELDGQRREITWGRKAVWWEADPDAMSEIFAAEGWPIPERQRTRSGSLTVPVVKGN